MAVYDKARYVFGVAPLYGLSALITGILLVARDKISLGDSTPLEALKNFYLRRALRIFPLYYLVVLVAVILDLGPARDLLWWLLSYTLNLKMAAQERYELSAAAAVCASVLFLPSRWPLNASLMLESTARV